MAADRINTLFSEDFWQHWHYGKNVEYRDGHHGNAILSKHPQQKGNNYDISAYRFEGRGLLHSITSLEGVDKPIHCFYAHLALFERGRGATAGGHHSTYSGLDTRGPYDRCRWLQ